MIPAYLIGLGRIGAGNSDLAGDAPLSHLAALLRVGGVRIAGLADPDPAARARVAARHPDLVGALAADWRDLRIEPGAIVALATPSAGREPMVAALLASRPGLIVAEKPIADDAASAARIARLADAASVALRVNFNRRFDARHRAWRARRPKQPLAVTCRYGKGLLNYASHAVDLLVDWYGPIAEVQALGPLRVFGAGDWTLSFRCRFEAGFDAVFIGLDRLAYDQLDMDIVAADGILEWRAGGASIAWRTPVDGRFYKGYRHLGDVPASADEGPVQGFLELYAAATSFLSSGAVLEGCSGQSAAHVAAVLDAARASAEDRGAPMVPSSFLDNR